jgi:ankyrin repeat protein
MIVHYLDFWDKIVLIESTVLAPEIVVGTSHLSDYDEDGNTLLHIAVKQNYERTTEFLVSAGAQISAKSEVPQDHAATPLVLASGQGNLSIVKILVNSGASVDEWNYSGVYPLHYASENGHTSIVQLLLELGATQKQDHDFGTPLHLAASNGHADVVHRLIAYGAKLAPLRRGATALWLAVANGHLDCVRILLEAGAAETEPHRPALGWSLLHLAVGGPHFLQAIDMACEQSIREICRFPVPTWKGGEKESWAEMIRLLVTSGANVFQELESVTPLLLAVLVGNCPAVEVLLSAGADIYSRNKYGRSALMFASLLGFEDIGSLLSKAKKVRPTEKKPVTGPKPKLTIKM